MARIALLLVIVAVVGACTDAPSPQPGWKVTLMSPSAEPSLTGTATPAPVRGAQGHPLSLPRVGTLTVGSAGVWHPSDFKAAAGNRFVAVSVSLSAKTKVALDRASFTLVDETLREYPPFAKGMAPAFALPQTLAQGTTVKGKLTFEVPYGGNYTLRLTPRAPRLTAQVSLTGLAAGQS